MPDEVFDNPRLADVYDPLDPVRDDLDAYLAMVDEFGARSVLDVGCGTGTFACLLAERGIDVVGVDPAAASLDVAQRKSHADKVRWLFGDATTLPELQVDLATMTGNVAQVFLTEDEWGATVRGVHAALRPGGRFVFETRDPARQAWRDWIREKTHSRVEIPGVGAVQSWHEPGTVDGEYVTFRSMTLFESDGSLLESTSTLWFRDADTITASLKAAGFRVDEIRGAPDRPGREFVFVARRPDRSE